VVLRKRRALVCGGLVIAVFSATAAFAGISSRIRDFANRWMGTPYLWGGETKMGIDCSGYVREMFRELFHAELPRTTKGQIDVGMEIPINPSALEKSFRPGDLIFYIDREGVPNHVVTYLGAGQITQSVSGRGVVIDPLRIIWGRRIYARRLLTGSGDDSGSVNAIPAAGPIVPIEIPCPPSVKAKAVEVKRYKTKPIDDIKAFGERDICDFRALADAVEGGGDVGRSNAMKLRQHAVWLESIEALKGMLGTDQR
jgi:hypothetical protein